MAKVGRNSIMADVQGMLGRQLVYKKRKGKPYVAAAPEKDPNRKPREGEQANRDRFKKSVEYSKNAVKDAQTKKYYEAVAEEWQTAINVAFKDAYYGPEVPGIISQTYTGQKGDIILVQARDNYNVVVVKVSIVDGRGNLIEQGNAIDNGDGLNWIYTAMQLNENVFGSTIVATAYDLPGNEGSLKVTLSSVPQQPPITFNDGNKSNSST